MATFYNEGGIMASMTLRFAAELAAPQRGLEHRNANQQQSLTRPFLTSPPPL